METIAKAGVADTTMSAYAIGSVMVAVSGSTTTLLMGALILKRPKRNQKREICS